MKDVLIEIKGTQSLEEQQQDVIELTTVGKLRKINDKIYLTYDDSTATGIDGATSTVKIDSDNSVVLQRGGNANSRMFIKKGQRHICHYATEQGTLTMGIFGETVQNDLSENGGRLYMSYTIDINYEMLSRNQVEITVKEV